MSNNEKSLTEITKKNTISSMTGRKNYTSQLSGKLVSRQANHFTVRLRQMKYDMHLGKPVALARGKYAGYPFLILNGGTHPTAYVCVPKGHKYYKKHDVAVNKDLVAALSNSVLPHGGFTYSRNGVFGSTITDRWWLGWDYGHIGLNDYIPMIPDACYRGEPKQWTREEIIAEVKEVIRQLEKVK